MDKIIKRFLKGQLQGTGEILENSQAYDNLYNTNPALASDLENIFMNYAHGECHTLTQALAQRYTLKEAALIVDWIGMPIHSGILSAKTPHIMDANGIHTLDECLECWKGITGGACSIRIVEPEFLGALCSADEDDMQMALEGFERLVDFMQEQELIKPQATENDISLVCSPDCL